MARITQQDIKNRLASRRRKLFSELSKPYKARIRRAGITPAQYNAGRVSLQRARGHKPAEHVTRRERNPAGLTSAEYRFVKNQQRRSGKADFSKQIAAFKRLSPKKRTDLRNRVANDHREYVRQKGKSGVVRGNIKELKETFREVARGGGGGGGFGGGGGGDDEDYEDYQEPYISEDEDYDYDGYDDDYAEFDDDLADLLFYH